VSYTTTGQDAGGPGREPSQTCDTACATDDLVGPHELVEQLREACALLQGADWRDWRLMLSRSKRDAASAALCLEEALPAALSCLASAMDSGQELHGREAMARHGDVQGQLQDARAAIAALSADLELSRTQEQERAWSIKRALDEELRHLETTVQELEGACGTLETECTRLRQSLQDQMDLVARRDATITEMASESEASMQRMSRAHAAELSRAVEEVKRGAQARAVDAHIDGHRRSASSSTSSSSTPRALNPFAANPFADEEQGNMHAPMHAPNSGEAGRDVLPTHEAKSMMELSGRERDREQHEAEEREAQVALVKRLEERLVNVEQQAARERARVEQEAASARRVLQDRLAAVETSREQDRAARDGDMRALAVAESECKTEREKSERLRCEVASLRSQLAAVCEESRLRGDELDRIYQEHANDLDKAAAALAAAQAAPQFANKVGQEAAMAEVVRLNAEMRHLKLAAEEADAAQGAGWREELVHQDVVNGIADSSAQVQQLLVKHQESEHKNQVLVSELEALQRECHGLQQECERLRGQIEAGKSQVEETLVKEKERADALSRQNSEIVHKLQIALKKKKDAESECGKAVAEAARHASDAAGCPLALSSPCARVTVTATWLKCVCTVCMAGAQCEARGLRAELQLLRQQYQNVRRNSSSFVLCADADSSLVSDGATVDLDQLQKVVVRGDPEEMENMLLVALDEIMWRRAARAGVAAAAAHSEVSIANETAAIRTEVLEMEVEHLTKEIVESRAARAAALVQGRIMSDDLCLLAREVGDLHAGLCIGLEGVLADGEQVRLICQ